MNNKNKLIIIIKVVIPTYKKKNINKKKSEKIINKNKLSSG